MSSASLTTRIDPALKAELESIARFERRSTSYMATQAITNLVEERRATRELVETGLALVDAGAPSLDSDDVHDWLQSADEAFPQGGSAD